MKLSRPIKLIVGAATLWLPLYMLAFFVFVFSSMFTHAAPDTDSFDLLFRVHMASSILSVALLVFYVVHLFQAKTLGDQRLMWALTIFFLGPFAMPFYFFKHVWPDDQAAFESRS